MKEELYDDVKEIENLKRIKKSIGWIDPYDEHWRECNENGKSWPGADRKKELKWDVYLGDGCSFECDTQFEAEVLSYLVQINIRLIRLESYLRKSKKEGKR